MWLAKVTKLLDLRKWFRKKTSKIRTSSLESQSHKWRVRVKVILGHLEFSWSPKTLRKHWVRQTLFIRWSSQTRTSASVLRANWGRRSLKQKAFYLSRLQNGFGSVFFGGFERNVHLDHRGVVKEQNIIGSSYLEGLEFHWRRKPQRLRFPFESHRDQFRKHRRRKHLNHWGGEW